MRIRRISVSLVILGALGCLPATADEPGKVGITMAYPTSFGILWHATGKFAIRPTVAISRSTMNGSTSNGDGWSLGTTIAGVFYVKKYDNVRTYFSPRYSYNRTQLTTHVTASTQGATIPDVKTTGNGNGAAATFGAEYTPASRFSVFAEVGVAFSRLTTSSSGFISSKISGNTWGTTAGVGVIFYP